MIKRSNRIAEAISNYTLVVDEVFDPYTVYCSGCLNRHEPQYCPHRVG